MLFLCYAAHTPEPARRSSVFDMSALRSALDADLKKDILKYDSLEQQMILIIAAEQKDENFLSQYIALIAPETNDQILSALSQRNPSPHFISTLLLRLKDRWDLRTKYFIYSTKQAQHIMIRQAFEQEVSSFLEAHATAVAQHPPKLHPTKRERELVPLLTLS